MRGKGGAPWRIRTSGLRIRSPTLYPAELRELAVSFTASTTTATSVPQPLSRYHNQDEWRRERDSNPRYPFEYAGLANLCLQPLGHLSTALPVKELHTTTTTSEEVGFEPTGSLRHLRFSRPLPSAARPLLHCLEPRGPPELRGPPFYIIRGPLQQRYGAPEADSTPIPPATAAGAP